MLTFLNSFLLLGLAGLAIPVLIHRINRARPKPWRFPSIRLIRQAPLPRQGKRRINDWLLLVLRMLIFALFILGLSGPAWVPQISSTEAPRTQVVVLIDQSASMAGWDAESDLRSELQALFDSIPTATATGYAVFADTILDSLPVDPLRPPNQTKNAIDDFLSGNPPKTVAGLPHNAIQEAMSLWMPNAARRLVIISDFQSSDWNNELPVLPDSINLDLIRVGSRNRAQNIAVMDAHTIPASTERIRILAEIHNFGTTDQPATLTLQADGSSTVKEVDLPARQTTSVGFELPVPTNPEATLTLSTNPEDPYLTDNQYVIWASQPPPINVLVMLPPGADPLDAEELFFFEEAMAAASSHEWLTFSVLPAGVHTLNPTTLERTGAVFLPAGQTSSADLPWDVLAEFVENGGLLIASLGNDAPRSLQRLRDANLSVGRYLGLAGRSRDARQRFHVGDIPSASPLSRVFSGDAARDLYLLTIYQHARLDPAPEATTLLESETGDPLIISAPSGRGNVVVSTFPWHSRASDLPLRPSFLPLVREILGTAVSDNSAILRLATHQSLPASLSGTLTTDMTKPAAFYHQGRPVEVNVSRTESIPDSIPSDRLVARLRSSNSSDASTIPSGQLAGGAISLAPWILGLALLLWLIEMIYASWLSNR